jgi:hypothetical protein
MIFCESVRGAKRAVLCNVLTLVSEGRITPAMAVRAYVGSVGNAYVRSTIDTQRACGGCDGQTCRHARGQYSALLREVAFTCQEGERDLQAAWAEQWEGRQAQLEGGRVD